MINWLLVFGVGVVVVFWLLVQLRHRAVRRDSPCYFLMYDGFFPVVKFESLKQFSIRRGNSVEGWGFNEGDVLDVYGDGYLLIDASLVKRLAGEVRSSVQVTKQELLSGVQAVIKAKKEADGKG